MKRLYSLILAAVFPLVLVQVLLSFRVLLQRRVVPDRIGDDYSLPNQLRQSVQSLRNQKTSLQSDPAVRSRNETTVQTPFVTDSLCPNCRYARDGRRSCWYKILQRHQSGTLTIEQAATEIAQNVPACAACDPASCEDKRYWRFDAAAPPVQAKFEVGLQGLPTDMAAFNPSIVRYQGQTIVSFRVSNEQNCGNRDHSAKPINYLGLAIVDEKFQVQRETTVHVEPILQHYGDPRLFVLQEKLYLSSFNKFYELSLVERPGFESLAAVLGPGSLSVFLATSPGACLTGPQLNYAAKNLNFFQDGDQRSVVEISPMGDKQELSADCSKLHPLISPTQPIPPASFPTMEEVIASQNQSLSSTSSPLTGERGSACCLPFGDNSLLLGISHSKTRYFHNAGQRERNGFASNHFVSSLYAMQVHPPYHTVARSGKFCLGSSNGSGIEPLQMGSVVFECPRIHFVSGLMTWNETHLVVAYGVNDCTSELVLLKWDDVMKLLYEGPSAVMRED